MLFRSRRPDTPVGDRFGAVRDGYVVRREGDVHVAEVATAPEDAVAHFAALLDELPEQLDLAIWCARSGDRYRGEGRFRSEIAEALGPLLRHLARAGGVEITIFSAEDQLTLSLSVELWVYSRSARWPLVLAARGIEEVATLRRRAWIVRAHEFTGAPEVVQSVRDMAERLTLSAAPHP